MRQDKDNGIGGKLAVSKTESSTGYATVFGGIDRLNGTPLGCWQELCGMDFTAYPALRTVKPFSYKRLADGITGYTVKNGEIVYTTADGIYISGKKTEVKLSDGEKQLATLGAYILILPDGVLVNTADEPVSVEYTAKPALYGELYEYNQNQTRPTLSIYKLLYLDVPENSEALARYSVGDMVKISYSHAGKQRCLSAVISSVAKETYSADGCVSVNFDTTAYSDTHYFYTEKSKMTSFRVAHIKDAYISSPIPEMDFIAEHNNRLWGCSSANHEVYCSKLGSAVEWGSYDGISTDAWAATVGSDGDFTGMCVYGGSVLFFKENCVHSVYGTKASNFTLSTIKLRGVQKGSGGSLCISDGLLYYKAPEGIFSFNGSASQRIDAKLGGDINCTAVMTANGRYIVMPASDGTVYYYDKRYYAWYTRVLHNVRSAHEINGRLYAVICDSDGKMAVVQLVGNDEDYESGESSEFCAVSGELGRGSIFRIYSKLRMSLYHKKAEGEKLDVSLYISADNGEWRKVYSCDGGGASDEEIAVAPIIPLRCRKIKIKICGEISGDAYAALYGIYLDSEKGSEIGG